MFIDESNAEERKANRKKNIEDSEDEIDSKEERK
jgi:hypothetical protein